MFQTVRTSFLIKCKLEKRLPIGHKHNASRQGVAFDGDGKRVKSVLTTDVGTSTTYFVGNYYEMTGGVVTKYYYAGSQRIAMRKDGVLNYLLSDHLGSTSLVTDAAGVVVSQQQYKAWGETRYTSGSEVTRYQYTGQYSYELDFGLQFYNARWYDSSLGRFAQADSIIPDPGNSAAWDRYAYGLNNPSRYTDPSGHMPVAGCGDDGSSDCYEDDPVIRNDNAAKLVTLEREHHDHKCAAGNRNYCSGWDNWAWKNIPSAIGVQGGINGQLGLGLEVSLSGEVSRTFNWRSGQIVTAVTSEPGVYFGTPKGASFSIYGGVHAMKGISNLEDLSGPDVFIDGSLSVDSVAQVGLSIERSQSLIESGGPEYIDPVSQMPQDTVEVNIGGGPNAIPNGVDGGLTFGESNSRIIFSIIDLYDWFE